MAEQMAEPVPSLVHPITAPAPIQSYKRCCNPCLCIAPQLGCKIIAIFEIVLGLLFLIGYVMLLDNMLQSNFEQCHDPRPLVGHMLNIMAVTVSHVVLAIFLLMGAIESSRLKCGVYFIGIIPLVIAVFVQIMTILGDVPAANEKPIFIYFWSGFFLYSSISSYFLFVVYSFMRELQFNKNRAKFPVPDKESQAGVPPSTNDGSSSPEN